MTDLDATLAARLGRLEAAIPAPPLPIRPVVRHRRRSRLRTIALLAAAITLVGFAGAVGANRMLYPDISNREVDRAIEEALGGSGTACIAPEAARTALRDRLDAHDLTGWTIETRPGVGDTPCLYAGQIPTLHVVALFPALGKTASEAIHAAADDLFNNCYGRGDAIALVSTASRSVGITKFEISADPWGPQGGPIDKIGAYQAHVAAGCFVYVGLGGKEDGTTVYYLWGPWP